MTGEFHYREKWPKEFRLQIQNEDEFKLLQLIFQDTVAGILKRYKPSDLEFIGKDSAWKKKVTEKSNLADEYGEYGTYSVYKAFEEEAHNMMVLEDASHI